MLSVNCIDPSDNPSIDCISYLAHCYGSKVTHTQTHPIANSPSGVHAFHISTDEWWMIQAI